ncbi:MAG: ABC transporter permease [Halioglobus sp.]|nr:ABC transporter permease [Halioglobus sp.]
MTVPVAAGAFRIVGVVAPQLGALAGEFADTRLGTDANSLFVPLSVEELWRQAPGESNPLDAIFVRAPDYQSADEALGGLRALLSQPDLGLSGLSWVIPASLIGKVREMQGTVALTVGTIAALCLLLGGTTLSSILVANVRERVAEIGLRRALGASRGDIVILFMAEGCLVALGAAFTGSLLTHLLLTTELAALTDLPVALGAASALLPLALAIAIGALFSYLPARAAARINPAQALKFE